MIFISISSVLFSIRYITAAIYGSGIRLNNQIGNESFERFLTYVGDVPLTLSIIALILGIIYIVWAELEKKKFD